MIQTWLAWSEPLSLLIALGLDAWFGDPVALYRTLPQPVVVIGKVIAFADRHCNRESDAPRRRRNAGILLDDFGIPLGPTDFYGVPLVQGTGPSIGAHEGL